MDSEHLNLRYVSPEPCLFTTLLWGRGRRQRQRNYANVCVCVYCLCMCMCVRVCVRVCVCVHVSVFVYIWGRVGSPEAGSEVGSRAGQWVCHRTVPEQSVPKQSHFRNSRASWSTSLAGRVFTPFYLQTSFVNPLPESYLERNISTMEPQLPTKFCFV